MPIYILVTNYNYDNELYAFKDNNDFLNWYSENANEIESLKHISREKDILFIDPSNLQFAYVRYHDSVDPNKHYREILAYDSSTPHFDRLEELPNIAPNSI